MADKFKNSKLSIISEAVKDKGVVQRMGGPAIIAHRLDVIPSGSLGLDIAMGCLGFPRGRLIEIYGPESCGKSTLAIATAVKSQLKYPDDEIGIVDANFIIGIF